MVATYDRGGMFQVAGGVVSPARAIAVGASAGITLRFRVSGTR